MVSSRRELESQAVHLKYARGVVVMCGVGMGIMLYNLCMKPDVSLVVAVDSDPGVIEWVRGLSAEWLGADKIRWLVGDALNLDRTALSRHAGVQDVADYLYADIWSVLGAERAAQDVAAIQSRLLARSVGWWGQEIDFVMWAKDSGFEWDMVDLDAFDLWCLDIDMVLHERSSKYIRYCRQVVINQSLA